MAPCAAADGLPQDAAAEAPTGDSESALAKAQLERQIGRLTKDSVEDRRAAAKAIADLGEDAVPAVLVKLGDVRREGEGGVVAAMKPVRDRVIRDPGFDIVEGLVVQKPEPGVTRLLLATCLLRALAHAGTTRAVRGMLPLEADLAGQLRPELVRQVKQLGDRATAALILARRDPSAEVRGWATTQLEALGKRTPGDMVQTSDNQALADVLRAFGTQKDLDALPVVLSFVNSDHATVRAAAREATLAYGQEAVWKVREAYAVLTGEPAPEGATASELAKKLFDAYDRYRLDDVYALLDAGLAKEKDRDLPGAVAAFDEVLARQPLLDRRAEMAPAYAEYGESLVDKDRAAAVANLRKAIRLDESAEHTKHVRSVLSCLEGEDLLARGIADTELFEQAIALDPGNARARARLEDLKLRVASGHARAWRLAGAGALLVAAFIAIAVFGGKRRQGGTGGTMVPR
jgi:hypothetical protein